MRHDRVDLDRAHPLADRSFHAQQTDAILVLHQLADRADPAVSEMIDIVDLAATILKLDQHLEDRYDVGLAQRPYGIVGLQCQPRVHLDAAYRRQVIALWIEE